MLEMTCAEYDLHASASQFIAHTVGRILEKLNLGSNPVTTKGYERLLDLVKTTKSDSFDFYFGLFIYNNNAIQQLEKLDVAFEVLKKDIYDHSRENQ